MPLGPASPPTNEDDQLLSIETRQHLEEWNFEYDQSLTFETFLHIQAMHLKSIILLDLPETFNTTKHLLPIHAKIMRVILKHYRGDYIKALQQICKLGGSLNDSVKELWKAIRILHLCLHFEPELLSIFLETIITSNFFHCNEPVDSVLECSMSWLKSLLLTIELPLYLQVRWIGKVNLMLCENLIKREASRIFDYILEDPDSKPQVKALRSLLVIPLPLGSLNLVLPILKNSFRERLLNGAIETQVITSQIVFCVNVLRELDPTGFLLDRLVFDEIKPYIIIVDEIRGRKDGRRTIVQVIISLVKEPGYDKVFQSSGEVLFDNAERLYFDTLPETWLPDPMEAGANPVRTSAKLGTVFSLLSNLFDSVEELIGEYRMILSETLLSSSSRARDDDDGSTPSMATDTVAQLELFKAKFPSPSWSSCDVMLRDYNECLKRKGLNDRDDGVSLLVLSHLYWPLSENPDPFLESFILPDLEHATNQLSEAYKVRHEMRSLKWRSDLAIVELEIQFGNDANKFCCSNLCAQVLLIVSEMGESVPVRKILEKFTSSHGLVLEAIKYWICKRVLHYQPEGLVVSLLENYDPNLPDYCDGLIGLCEGGGGDGGNDQGLLDTLTATLSQDDVMIKYWPFIIAMLTNLGELRIERIQSMLGTFAGDYREPIDSLVTFLNAKVKEGILIRSAASSAYSLARL